ANIKAVVGAGDPLAKLIPGVAAFATLKNGCHGFYDCGNECFILSDIHTITALLRIVKRI
ncbi:MAG: hypothetical protein ACOYME_04445, partial [Prochlorotrichaceae cyanobacterium]